MSDRIINNRMTAPDMIDVANDVSDVMIAQIAAGRRFLHPEIVEALSVSCCQRGFEASGDEIFLMNLACLQRSHHQIAMLDAARLQAMHSSAALQ